MKTIEKLTEEEQRIIDCEREINYLAIIKSLSEEELKLFDKFIPKDLRHYNGLQRIWLETERYLIGSKLNHNPTDLELIEDSKINHNAERFKVWYVFHYAEKVVLK